jgi:ribosomal protein L27
MIREDLIMDSTEMSESEIEVIPYMYFEMKYSKGSDKNGYDISKKENYVKVTNTTVSIIGTSMLIQKKSNKIYFKKNSADNECFYWVVEGDVNYLSYGDLSESNREKSKEKVTRLVR